MTGYRHEGLSKRDLMRTVGEWKEKRDRYEIAGKGTKKEFFFKQI
jgi:hypothetical protein